MSQPLAFAIRMPPAIGSIQIGNHHAIVVDNFLENPQALVADAVALQNQFTPYPKFEDKKGYPGIRAEAPATYSSVLAGLVEPLIKANFNVPQHVDFRKSICAYSLTTMQPEELGPLQRIPHFDSSTPHHFAVLLYLCDESHGGTGFYRHNATGFQQITADNREHYLDVSYQEINAQLPKQRYFDKSDERYTFLGMIPAKFNRLVIYHGSLLHSACVNPAISLTDNPSKGRLTLNSFFDFNEPD